MGGDVQALSYWLGLDEYLAAPPLEGRKSVDVAIVGGGFTGLFTAHLLLTRHPGIKLCVLEQCEVGAGASGRGSGIIAPRLQRGPVELARRFGDEAAAGLSAALLECVEHIAEVIARAGIDCDLQRSGMLSVSSSPAQDPALAAELAAARSSGSGRISALSAAESQLSSGSCHVRAGIRDPGVLLVDPARLVRGLRQAIEALGGCIHEQTRVEHWSERETGVSLVCARGTVEAQRMLIATGAYGLARERGRNPLRTFYAYTCLTEQLDAARWSEGAEAAGEALEDQRTVPHYFRRTADQRILCGGRDLSYRPQGPAAAHDRDALVFARLRESFEDFFPGLRDVSFRYRWGAPVGMSSDWLPRLGFFDPRKRRAAFAFGSTLHGIAASHLAAHAIADLFGTQSTRWTELALLDLELRERGLPWLRDIWIHSLLSAQVRADDEGRRDLPWSLRVIRPLLGSALELG